MTTLSGTLRKVDLGTGGWVLELGKGKVMLFGDVPEGLAGKKVEVQGHEIKDGASFLMAADRMFEVAKIREA